MVLLVVHDRGYADLQSLKYRAGDSCTALDCKLYSVNFQLNPQLLTQSLSQNIKTRRVSEGRPHEFPRSRVGLGFYAEGFRIGSQSTIPANSHKFEFKTG